MVHDETVGRPTTGTGTVVELNRSDLEALDGGDGGEVPTLDEILDYLGNEHVRFRVQLKERQVGERVLETITERSLEDRTTLSSFDHEALEPVADAPVRIGVVASEMTEQTLEAVEQFDSDALFVNLDSVDRSDVEAPLA